MREIIWEYTLRCSKRCDYCGSKNVLDSAELSNDDKIRTAASIVDYKMAGCGPDSVDISGGEPSETDPATLLDVVRILSDGGIEVKILTNGGLFDKIMTSTDEWKCIADLVSTIGYSVNTAEDTAKAVKLKGDSRLDDFHRGKITIITNFGRHNFWDYQRLADVGHMFGAWQVQLTSGKEYILPSNGIAMLRNMLTDHPNAVMGDDLSVECRCQAGRQTMGILADGQAVPCLSMRCWDDIRQVPKDRKLPTISLQEAWETDPLIRDYRFGRTAKCCRDEFDYPTSAAVELPKGSESPAPPGKTITHPPLEIEIAKPSRPDKNMVVCMYAVFSNYDSPSDYKIESVTTTSTPDHTSKTGGAMMRYGVFNNNPYNKSTNPFDKNG